MHRTDVARTIREREDELVDLTARLVEMPTVTGNERPGQDVIAEKLESMGVEYDLWEPDPSALRDHEGYFETSSYVDVGYDDRPNIAARIEGGCDIEGGGGPTLTVGGHIDVVDVTESEWTYDPWSLTRDGDTVYGRGVADMKGGLAAVLLAIEALRDCDVELGGDLVFQSTIEEEDGGVGGALSALERGYVPDAAIVAEPFDVPNLCVASAGVMYFRITVPGKSVHAAWGHEGVNAIDKAAAVYRALEDLDDERKARIDYPPAYRADPALEGNVTNLNVGTIEAGNWPSTLPAEAVLEGRIGWPPGESRAEVREQITDALESVASEDGWLADNPPEIEWFGWQAEPHETDTDEPIVRIAHENAEAVTGSTGEFVGGNAAMDERFFQLYYDVPAVSVGPAGHSLHGADEHTTVPSLLDTAEIVARTILDYLGTAD